MRQKGVVIRQKAFLKCIQQSLRRNLAVTLIALRGKAIKQQGSCGEDPVPVASGENDAKVPAVFFIEAVKAWGIEQHVLPHWRGFQHVLVSS
ncbi:hypothetical protein Bca4012_045061 [Brassica carinata]